MFYGFHVRVMIYEVMMEYGISYEASHGMRQTGNEF